MSGQKRQPNPQFDRGGARAHQGAHTGGDLDEMTSAGGGGGGHPGDYWEIVREYYSSVRPGPTRNRERPTKPKFYITRCPAGQYNQSEGAAEPK